MLHWMLSGTNDDHAEGTFLDASIDTGINKPVTEEQKTGLRAGAEKWGGY